jgi:hypothetical protein
MTKKHTLQTDTASTTTNKTDHTLIIMFVLVILFSVISLAYATYLISPYEMNSKIIKVKYVSLNVSSIVDECNHPTLVSGSLSTSQINISDIYQIDIGTSYVGNEIKHIKLVEKEKYVKKC